jgi:hypothetical protein
MSLNNNNNTYLTIPPAYVYFKEAWTTNRKTYLIYPDWTLNQFRDALKPLVGWTTRRRKWIIIAAI